MKVVEQEYMRKLEMEHPEDQTRGEPLFLIYYINILNLRGQLTTYLITWRLVLNRYTDNINVFSRCDPWILQHAYASSGIAIRLHSLYLHNSWRWDVERLHFHQTLQDWCFQNLSIWGVWPITPGDGRYPQ